jgi:hypothetical protein
VIDLIYTYVTIFCSWRLLFQEVLEKLPEVKLALNVLAGGYLIPIALALITLIRWFENKPEADRTANQRAVLRGLLAVLAAWGATVLIGLAWWEGLRDPSWVLVCGEWPCWQGPPFPTPSAATSVALGATLWRQNRRWGLGCFLIGGIWVGAQASLSLYYPMDIVFGTVVGIIIAWLLGAAWLNRPLEAFIRLVRRRMLA